MYIYVYLPIYIDVYTCTGIYVKIKGKDSRLNTPINKA